RRRRLDVEVAVAEHRRRARGIRRGRQLPERELLLAVRRQLRGAADTPDELANPLAGLLDVLPVRRVGADARDRAQLGELGAGGVIHQARLYVAAPGEASLTRPAANASHRGVVSRAHGLGYERSLRPRAARFSRGRPAAPPRWEATRK